MADWDDSDDDWDKSDDELDKRLGLVNVKDDAPPAFDDEDEDLTLKDKEREEKINAKLNKAKGSALKDKKAAEAAADGTQPIDMEVLTARRWQVLQTAEIIRIAQASEP